MRAYALIAGAAAMAALAAGGQHARPAGGETAMTADIRRLGLATRLEPERRDDHVRKLAAMLSSMSKDAVFQLQRPFQEAFLLVCDADIRETLAPGTVEAVDGAIESVLTLEDIGGGTRWDALVYVYGFFNHDVTPDEIREARETWENTPMDERARIYPSYIHLIDAACKPLSVGPLRTADETREALETAVPLLASMVEQPPRPGTAFHEPTHAALILPPMYERWAGSDEFGAPFRERWKNREAFAGWLADRLVGSLENRMDLGEMEYRFYFYTARYIANALARLGDPSAIPALRATFEVCVAKNAPASTVAYVRRALTALGDADEREALERSVEDSAGNALDTAVWLIRNAKGEGREYGEALAAEILGCAPREAMMVYFRQQWNALE